MVKKYLLQCYQNERASWVSRHISFLYFAHHFGVQNIGLKLQKLDSELMANALTKLDGMPCLPVHDSIRCRLSDMRMVTDAMIEAFRELHGQKIVVTNDLSKIAKYPIQSNQARSR